MMHSASKSLITTPWWKLLLLTVITAAWTYLLLFAIQYIRIQQYTWARPVLTLSEKYNGAWTTPAQPYSLTDALYKWDSYYYLDIARNGYNQIPFATDKRHNWAFFPLLPILLAIPAKVFGYMANTDLLLLTGMFISNACFFAGLLIWKKLANLLELSQRQWQTFLTALVVFPLSYIFHMVYTESVFFLLTTAAIYCIAQKRYLPSAWLIGLSAVTRVTGLVLIPFLLASYLWNKRAERNLAEDALWILGMGVIAITPFTLFFNYLGLLTGELLAPLKIQAAWNNDNSLPFSTFIGYFKDYGLSFHPDHGASIVLLLLSWSLVIWSGFVLWRKKERSELEVLLWAFTALLVLVNSSINSRSSIFRYTITIPYLFVIAGQWLSNRKWKRWLLVPLATISLSLQILFLTFFLWLIPLYGF